MADKWFMGLETTCSEEVKRVLLHSRKRSSHNADLQKWMKFNHSCDLRHLSPVFSPLSDVLDYIFELKRIGLCPSSISVHLAAVMAFHPLMEEFLVFVLPTTMRFLKGLGNLFPLFRHPTLVWDLNQVPRCLTRPPLWLPAPSLTCV